MLPRFTTLRQICERSSHNKIIYSNNRFLSCSLTPSNTRPLTRSDTEMTFNSYWDRLATVPSLNEGSTSFDSTNACGFPGSNLLGRSDTVSSFNSTWDEHIISSSKRNDDSFSECSGGLLNTHSEYGLGASLDIEDDSQMSDGEESNSDDDTGTECGDYLEFHTECENDINMDSEASVDVPVACGLPSLRPFVPNTSPPSATSGQYMGLMTRARTRRMEQPDAEPAQKKAKLDVHPTADNKNSQQDSAATYSIIWYEKRKSYYCNTCHQINKRKDWMMRHVRDKHPLQNSDSAGR